MKWVITILAILCCSLVYVAIDQYQDKTQLKIDLKVVNAKFEQYKTDNNSVKQLDLKIMGALEDGNKNTNNLRDAVNAGLVELLVRTEAIERDSSGASTSIQNAVRLAESTRQDYYDLRNGIEQNRIMILGWQEYYCKIIAPKNKTEYLCEGISWQ